MIIRSERELALFEETLDQCQNTVWLISTCGKQYDLMNPLERCLGIAEMLKYQRADEPEIFTTSYGDAFYWAANTKAQMKSCASIPCCIGLVFLHLILSATQSIHNFGIEFYPVTGIYIW